MFGTILYYDKKTIDEYMSVILDQQHLEIEELEVSNDKGAGIDLKAFSADAKATKTYKAKVQQSLLYESSKFEKALEGRDDFFDFTKSSEYDLCTIQRGSIIKLDSYIDIPEEFDLIQFVGQFMPTLLDEADLNDLEKQNREVVLGYLKKTTATKIPIIMNAGDSLLAAKIKHDLLVRDYSELEECEEEQATILARVASGIVYQNKAFYDPLKDFVPLNRSIRKSFKDRGKGLQPLYLDREYRLVDVLAIYR